ncbi:beta-glucosidase [Fistulifera solaris]|uniref:beta-glucosidase n=1 Tax=Fistulifera solaris TaxID=1519565 RepID=A0A1Z5K3X3_FISSO|nr:beta-glucosidase [Fistulifera solaris]|eukprot:GAX20872.1 beta-glucosidase [Fistulifera solaris]
MSSADDLEKLEEGAGQTVSERTWISLNEKQQFSVVSGASLWTLCKLPGLPTIAVSDGPHGVRKPINPLALGESHPATCFPTASALACSWNQEAAKELGEALALECLHYNIQILLGPGMNLKRHPAGGRSFEYWSEDPCLTGKMAAAYVEGVEASGKVGACIKHFAINNQESHRFVVDAVVDERTMRELYLRHFEYVIKKANPSTVMCAYNKVNGVYCSENSYLNRTILRDEWLYGGVLMTDWGATNDRARGIKATVDLEMPGSYGVHNRDLKRALSSPDDDLTEHDLRECGMRVLDLIQRYAPSTYESDAMAALDNPIDFRKHFDMALRLAKESVVLLRNENNMLPLPKGDESLKIGVIGDFANEHPRYQGMGSSAVQSEKVVTVLDALKKFTKNIDFAKGYEADDDHPEDVHEEFLSDAIEVAENASVVLLCIGLPEIMESEGFDRTHLQLPAQHNALVEACCKVNSNVVVLLSNGGALELPWYNKVQAIMEGYLLGEAGGKAFVDLIFGEDCPSGKLAETFPVSASDIPCDTFFPGTKFTVEYREGLNVGYRYFDTAQKPVLYPFGHGLSYTTFEYSDLRLQVLNDSSVVNGDDRHPMVELSFLLTNTGLMAGKEVAQCYVSDIESTVYRPVHELRDFVKISLNPGERKEIKMILTADAFSFYDIGVPGWVIENGVFEIQIGASSRDIRLRGQVVLASGVLQASIQAQQAYPPESVATISPLDDLTFAKRLLLSCLPAPEIFESYFHRNSLLKETALKSMIGWILLEIVYREASKDITQGSSRNRQLLMVRKNVENLPLRVLVAFSRGNFTFDLLDALIAIMNGHVLSAFWGFGNAFVGMFFPRR